MTFNDYYYLAVTKQRAAEIQATAAGNRLAKIAHQANKEKRARLREAQRQQAALQARSGLWRALRTLSGPDQPATNEVAPAVTEHVEATVDETVDKPAAAARC